MDILIKKDFTWSHNGRLSKYRADQIATVDSKTAAQMIKAEYAVEAEHKMINVSQAENKMFDPSIDNKMADMKPKKSKKAKEVDNE
jgi:hypothetical protein